MKGKTISVHGTETRDRSKLALIGACHLIVQAGDDDGYVRYLVMHWLPPGDPD